MKVDIVRPQDAAWGESLDRSHHDFYHLPGYVALEARRIGGEAFGVLLRDGADSFLLPLIRRPIEVVWSATCRGADAVSPYGYPNPLVSKGAQERFVRAAAANVSDALREFGVVSAFVRLHPLLGPSSSCLEGGGSLVAHGETVWVDLSETEAELWAQTRPTYRNCISKAKRSGYLTRIDEEWSRFREFMTIYDETMRRVDATSEYFFGEEFFHGLREALGARLKLCVVEHGSEVAAAGLFVETDGIVQYHLSGTAEAHLRMTPTRMMLDYVRWWARDRGNRALHLGGGVGGRADSLFHFKAGLAKGRAQFSSWRIVADPVAYDGLVAEWARVAAREAPATDGFFPAYRCPVGAGS